MLRYTQIVTIASMNIPKQYTPKDWEPSISRQWEESGCYNPDVCVEKGITQNDAPTFSIVLPPPNATGHLHIGHAAMLAIEDTMVRYRRMKGNRTLWIPGTDHAAIATQEKVERILYKETGQTRHDLGREQFLSKIHTFVEESRDFIKGQIRAMGSSVDWSREAFTLDEKRQKAVNKAFKAMYDDGIISRGDRIVNWDPKLHTTVSDDEVDHCEETATFYYLQYGPFVIGTARPETKFGDKCVVVHPDDDRYSEYQHGQTIEVEWIGGTIVATIIKDNVIDRNFGTGAMTITPWHDAIDFDIAERHHLEKQQIIDYQGKMLPIAGEFAGMSVEECRTQLVEKLRAKGLLVKIEENYVHNVARNSRGGGMIEPQIMRQWFVNVNKSFERGGKHTTLKTLMQESVRSGGVNVLPKRFEKNYFHWIDNLRDWCISRQIWYGHPIPVWYDKDDNVVHVGEPPTTINPTWKQDPDTLDTWFSSGLWTFSTLGWPDNTKDLQTYHPTSVLETGSDILFFWVARMILMSTYLLGEVPFRTVYLHGLVRDDQGRKMSKSLGNTIDPLDMIEKYGTDAVRLSLLIGSTPGNSIRLGSEKIEAYRNFTNKLWNIGRYVAANSQLHNDTTVTVKTDADHWIMSKLDQTHAAVEKNLESYQFSLAGETLRDFTWNTFADWYVEIHKIEKNDTVLRHVFSRLLMLWHPFMPFVTEVIWHILGNKTLLMVSSWPSSAKTPPEKTEQFDQVINLIQDIRAIRASYRINPTHVLEIFMRREDIGELYGETFRQLARVSNIHSLEEPTQPKRCATCPGATKAYVDLGSGVDIGKERDRLTKEIDELKRHIISTEHRLKSADYITKAPKHIVEQSQEQLKTLQLKLERAREMLNRLS